MASEKLSGGVENLTRSIIRQPFQTTVTKGNVRRVLVIVSKRALRLISPCFDELLASKTYSVQSLA